MPTNYIINAQYTLTSLNGQPCSLGPYSAYYQYQSDTIDGSFRAPGKIYLAPCLYPPAPDNLGQTMDTRADITVAGGVVTVFNGSADVGPLGYNFSSQTFNFTYTNQNGANVFGSGTASCTNPVPFGAGSVPAAPSNARIKVK